MPRQHGKDGVYRKVIVTVLALALGGCLVLGPSPVSAQQPNPQNQPKNVAPKPQAKPPVVRPQNVPRRSQTTTPRTVKPAATTTRRVTTPKTVTPKVTTKPVTTKPVVTSKPVVTPKPVGTPKPVVTVKPGPKVVVAGKIRGVPARGTGRTLIHGRNYTIWRGGHRFRHRGHWRTFVAISALSAIMFGTASYYPYAYITAPEPYCSGLTEDGCELHWQDVQTIEGDLIAQCVAYCPWQ